MSIQSEHKATLRMYYNWSDAQLFLGHQYTIEGERKPSKTVRWGRVSVGGTLSWFAGLCLSVSLSLSLSLSLSAASLRGSDWKRDVDARYTLLSPSHPRPHPPPLWFLVSSRLVSWSILSLSESARNVIFYPKSISFSLIVFHGLLILSLPLFSPRIAYPLFSPRLIYPLTSPGLSHPVPFHLYVWIQSSVNIGGNMITSMTVFGANTRAYNTKPTNP